MKTTTLIAATLLLATASGAEAGSKARYVVTFDGTWSAASHPLDYPSGAHFSGLIGATHGEGYSLFREGGTATPGLENLAEKGAHRPLDAEIRAQLDQGKAGALIEGQAIFGPPGQASVELEIDDAHPMVSLVAMIAPSPDWFAGAADVALLENGQWVAERTVTLEAWDAGTDAGATYKASDADMMPRGPVQRNASAHFVADGQMVPVGTVTFKRL